MFAMFAAMMGVTLGIIGGVCLLESFIKPIAPQFYNKYYLILLQDEDGNWEVREELNRSLYLIFNEIFHGDDTVCIAEICEFADGRYTYKLDV